MSVAKLAQQAADELGIEIFISPSGRAYYYVDEMRTWCWITAGDLVTALEVRRTYPRDTYLKWCARKKSRTMSKRAQKALGL